MSEASSVRQVVFLRKGSVYMPFLQSNMGDLYQEYQGTAGSPTNISPDFSTLTPMLSYIITSSLVAAGLVVPNSVKWYFNDTELIFGSDKVSTNSFNGETGHFQSVPYQAGVQNYFALKIKKNLVKASGGAACNIKAEATIAVGNTSDKVQAVYNIPITVGVGNNKRVTIMAGDNKFFTLTDKGDSCVLKAVAWIGSAELNAGQTYKWYTLQSGSWVLLDGQTQQTLTVTNDMVDTTGQFKVEVFQDGFLIGMDVQTVIDASDPFDILPNPNPENETIEQGSGGSVTYTPILVKRGSTTKFKDMKFFFVFTDSAGNILNPDTAKVASYSGTVTEAMCEQASGNVAVVITTEE